MSEIISKFFMTDFSKNRRRLAEIYQETIDIVNNGQYETTDGKIVVLGSDLEMRQNSRFYSKEFTVHDFPCKSTATEIDVVNNDSIDAGLALKDEGYNPVVLNFANRRNAGGGVLNGARAQEETIFRRTNLFRSLYQFMYYAESFNLQKNRHQYPMDPNFGGVYTPYATVFRASNYTLLNTPQKISFISVAAMNRPRLIDDMIAFELIPETLNKIRTILRIGLYHGHDAIVLGAFGCGAFKNPPTHIALLFKQVINDLEFKHKFKRIVFAIIEDHNSFGAINPTGNFQSFVEVFSGCK